MLKVKECKSLKPAGHYSLATVHDGMIYISGQLPIDADTGEKVFGDITKQVATVLNNIEMILKEVGSSKKNVLKVSIYIPDVALWGAVDHVYSQFFEEHKPARIIVPSGKLHHGFSVEIDAIAHV